MWVALLPVWVALPCVWVALPCVWVALPCVWVALLRVWVALPRGWVVLLCVQADTGQVEWGFLRGWLGLGQRKWLLGRGLGCERGSFNAKSLRGKGAKEDEVSCVISVQCYIETSRIPGRVSRGRAKACPEALLSILNPPFSILFGCGFAAPRPCVGAFFGVGTGLAMRVAR